MKILGCELIPESPTSVFRTVDGKMAHGIGPSLKLSQYYSMYWRLLKIALSSYHSRAL